MSYGHFSSVVLILVGAGLIVLRNPLSTLQLAALSNFDYVKKNRANVLRRLRIVAIIFGLIAVVFGVILFVLA